MKFARDECLAFPGVYPGDSSTWQSKVSSWVMTHCTRYELKCMPWEGVCSTGLLDAQIFPLFSNTD